MRRLVLLLVILASCTALADAPAVFQQQCAACHGADRLGATGPALLPESLERLKKTEALKTIRDGRAATQMPPFADKLAGGDIEAIVNWIYTPVLPAPRWSEADIQASRIVNHAPGSLPAKPAPIFDNVDMMNLFLVVEGGDHHVSVLDGDRLEPIHRFASRYALHGGPKLTRGRPLSSFLQWPGSRSTTSGTWPWWRKSEPVSIPAMSPFPAMANTSPWPTTCPTPWCCLMPI